MAELDLSEFRSEHHAAWAKRAVLLVDVVGSVSLMEQGEAGIISHWLDFVDHVKRRIVPNHNGRFVKSLGDGMLLDFADMRSAVSAALAVQQERHRANSARAGRRGIMLRIGMEVSDAPVADDVLGRSVNLAARLMSLAGPGEIAVSQNVRDGLIADLDADIEDLGDCDIPAGPGPVRAYRIGPPEPNPTLATESVEGRAPSIAVVPFASRSAATDRGVIGEILAEEVIRCLSQSASLKVVSRLSTTAFSGRAASLKEISAHLGADYVLSGAYRAGGTRLKLDAELAEARTGRVLWSESLEDDLAGIVSGEQELIGRLIAAVGAAVAARDIQRPRCQPLPTLKAYSLMMAAVSLMHRLSRPDFEESRRLLEALIDRGVRHPLPVAWLGNWHLLRVAQGWSDDPQRDTSLASECTKRALDLDPDNSLALAVDGFVHVTLLKKFDAAEAAYGRALAANPSNAVAWLLKGALHAVKGEGVQAIGHAERALSLSPLDPHRYFYDSLAATAAVSGGHYERAVELARRSLRSNRKHSSTWHYMTAALWQLGRFDDARLSAQESLKLQPFAARASFAGHDESFMPSEVVEAVKQAGRWAKN